jgi:hypothetical protein
VVSGVGIAFLYVAHVNRSSGDTNPWPWLAIGVVLIAGGILMRRSTIRRKREALGG